MLVEQFQIGPCIVDMFGWCRSLATGTDGIEALGIKGQRRFKAHVALPLGIIIVDVPETLVPLEAEATQHDMARIGAVAAIILAKNVETMQVFVAPIEDDLEYEVELGQGGVTSDQESTPDERTDAPQDDAQLIDVRVCLVLFHAQSVGRKAHWCKGSPRNLALSLYAGTAWWRLQREAGRWERPPVPGMAHTRPIASPRYWTRVHVS